MQGKFFGVICAGLAVLILLLPSDNDRPEPVPPKPPTDIVEKSFDTYEQLWRTHALKTADKLESGELKTDKDTWEFIAAGQEPARKVAFDEIAKKEQEYFEENGGWTPELHAELLRGYGNE